MPKFQPGQSGNPKGRPKGSRNVATQYLAEVSAPAGERTKLQAIIGAQFDKALAGDYRAGRDIVERVEKLEAERDAAREMSFTAADREVIMEIRRRLVTADEGADPPPAA